MVNGANSVHKQLRRELEDYIKSQYFEKSPILLDAINEQIDDVGLLYQEPYIESSPAYTKTEDGITKSNLLKPWLKDFFSALSSAGLGVFPAPFNHQIAALGSACSGQDLFVATGTGSGKTECFMWPLIAKLAVEAHDSPETWNQRGVRTIIMYPMNALVSDQVGRLRRLIGDKDNRFIQIFRDVCGKTARRPQFGMYTGRTPYPGPKPNRDGDRDLEHQLKKLMPPEGDQEKPYYEKLLKEGKIPSKANMVAFLERIHRGEHTPDAEDAELITRFEMQKVCPDILITNYSMLEYMLLRPRENKIWKDTKAWLDADEKNKLLFVIDEAHMYRGSSGGEVALLIRRLFHKLGISRNRVQFILTTASMPNNDNEDRRKVMDFAAKLTSADDASSFCYYTGEREELLDGGLKDIPVSKILTCDVQQIETESTQLDALNQFWDGIEGGDSPFASLEAAYDWMYSSIAAYRPFYELIKACRGEAVSLDELAKRIFPLLCIDDALKGISTLLAIAPLARSREGSVLFPARMHMLFRGIKGVYACTNPNCPCSRSDGYLTLGKILLSDSQITCPECQSAVYELYNDRRCGALFFKGYIMQEDAEELPDKEYAYLWHNPGQVMDSRLKEIHLFIPSSPTPPKKAKPCYLDIHSGYLYFKDDAKASDPNYRKLFYGGFYAPGRPEINTFVECPHCTHRLSKMQLTSFSTKGNQSFFNLIQSQFEAQLPVPGKTGDEERLPNEGRKVLLFSDSRQRAAKLARDMSELSDVAAARQLFAVALSDMEQSRDEHSLNDLYDYLCLASAKNHVQLFASEERKNFREHCRKASRKYRRAGDRYAPSLKFTDNASDSMKALLLRLYCGGYNTLPDAAISWLEPTSDAKDEALDILTDAGCSVSEEVFDEVFNAWCLSVCDTSTALGQTITDKVRERVRPIYGGYGITETKVIPPDVIEFMGWKKQQSVINAWTDAFRTAFLEKAQFGGDKLYIDISKVRPRLDFNHKWIKCKQCSEISPYPLNHRCPSCGSVDIHEMTQAEYDGLSFWRNPIFDALKGERIRVIDTEEHTAQLSHKDQRDNLWSQTEKYEMRFQDMIEEDETPVDILSSTTTMEVGIDIGSLVAVGLRNIPPMRENYQQRAGRAGRRGSSLSTIVTYCEDGPHDSLYFKDPTPMLRGDPRRPWIDVDSEKLLQRHIAMIALQDYLKQLPSSMDDISAARFLDTALEGFLQSLETFQVDRTSSLLRESDAFDIDAFRRTLSASLLDLKKKKERHPELFGKDEEYDGNPTKGPAAKSLLDALYEEGIIPTYSFPKNVVSTYISLPNGKVKYSVDRGLDVAIGEYAPGRAIVVDKETYQIGGFYFPGSERKPGCLKQPAKSFMEDPNYIKDIKECSCGWFGLAEDNDTKCPFCGNTDLQAGRRMLRPWGFAPRNAEPIEDAQLAEEYTQVQQPLYSTLADKAGMHLVPGCSNIRASARSNQRVIMLNKGSSDKGFSVCVDCGAAIPGNEADDLKVIGRPYKTDYLHGPCRHTNVVNVNLGYDFITDMLVLEIKLDDTRIDTTRKNNPWLNRAAQSLAEALRIVASKELDIEFTELVTGYRLRQNEDGSFIDLYLYDSLSSGAGYAVSIESEIGSLLKKTSTYLENCTCASACHNCLKHYRNQYVHGMLDRFAALQLLQWGTDNTIAPPLPTKEQIALVAPLKGILSESGCQVSLIPTEITVRRGKTLKKLEVYPAMWTRPHYDGRTIFVSDMLIKYAKPYAVAEIIDSL